MATVETGVRASVGFASKTGPRKANEDFAGALSGAELPEPRQEVIAAIADGIGGAKGGRIAAETAVRGFLDGFCDLPETMEVQRAGARIVSALNGWINTMGRQDPKLAGMGCTLTALVLRGRVAHLLHVGDTRAYRLSGDRLTCLTTDHVRQDGAGRSHTLTRALGVEAEVRLDYATQPVALHDRFLLCSDGVHGFLTDQSIADILRERSAPEDTAGALVTAALQSGSTDNCTALVLDVVALPTAGSADISAAMLQLPVIPVPLVGETIDGFVLKALISEGRYTRLFGAEDEVEGGNVALKFPKPQIASVEAYRAAFVREAWVGARVHNPWVGRVIELPPGRQTCLYTVMPLYQGELLETRLSRSPALGLEEGRNIAVKLARAVAALHRAGIIHRDIKPDNVILEGGGSLKADRSRGRSRAWAGGISARGHPRHRRPIWRLKCSRANPATRPPTFMLWASPCSAPSRANSRTAISTPPVRRAGAGRRTFPRCGRIFRPGSKRRSRARSRSIPRSAFDDMTEFAFEMEAGPARAPTEIRRPRTLYERAPLQVWQGMAALLAFALLASLLVR